MGSVYLFLLLSEGCIYTDSEDDDVGVRYCAQDESSRRTLVII